MAIISQIVLNKLYTLKMQEFKIYLLQFFLLFNTTQIISSTVYNIGFLLNNENLKQTINESIKDINKDPDYFGFSSDKLETFTHILSKDPMKATKDICEHLVAKQIHLLITTNPVNDSKSSPDIVSYIGAFYKIPVIAVQARGSELTDKKKHPTLLRTVPPYFDQARGWANLLKHFKWNKVNLIASNDYDGRITYIKFTSWAYKHNIVIEKTILLDQDNQNISSQLQQINDTRTKVNLLACSDQHCGNIFKEISNLNFDSEGFIWISNQQAITGKSLENAPNGLLALRLQKEASTKLHIRDAIRISAKALEKHSNDYTIAPPPSSCHESAGLWKSGDALYQSLLNTTINGTTGEISFDWYGDRKNAAYRLINVRREKDTGKLKTKIVGTLYNDDRIDVNMSDIIWPGNLTQLIKGIYITSHLRIVTVESQPFLYVVEMDPSGNCSNLDYTINNKLYRHLHCNGPSNKFPGRDHCCKGFCMDLLLELASKVNFTYDIHLVEDGKFGSLKKVNGSNIKRWNGMVGELVDGKADLVMASLTINNDRAQYIDYSKPFKYQGITILVKKKEADGSLSSFLLPFKPLLWVLVLISVHVVAIILYLLDRFSPFGRYRLTQSNKEETALNLSSAVWFSWGVLLNSGIGESTPRSFSARVLGMVWAGFAMIIVASYTANLAAFLVLDRPQPIVTGVDDPLMRNPSDKFPYGTVMNSSVDAYFRRQVELSSMYTFMEKYNVPTEKDGIDMVKNGSLKAFIWDSPVLIYEKSNYCDFTTVGELFGRSGYGVGMPKGSSWSNNISLEILYMHESGKMEEFNSKWIKVGGCKKQDNRQPATLGLKHMLGVFIMVAAGIGAGIIIVVLEVLYYKQKGWRKDQKKVVKKTADIWQGHVQERKQQRQAAFQQGSNGVTTENGSTMNGNANHNKLDGANGEPNPIYSNDHTH